jgi:predicted RNase H-like HicB family nuclease
VRYKIAVHQTDEGYSVSAPGSPGCWSQGKTEAEALANIETAMREYLSVVEGLVEDAEIRR